MNVSNFKVAVVPSMNTYQYTAYRLQITNLYAETVEFSLETRVTTHPDRFMVGSLQLYFGDKPNPVRLVGTNWASRGQTMVATESFTLRAEESTAFNIAIESSVPTIGQPISVIGHVRLRVPVRRAQDRFIVNSQYDEPIPVLLSASQIDSRGSYRNYARNLDGVTQLQLAGSDWYSTEAIPLASGKAENLIEPEGFHFKDVIGAVSKLRDFRAEGPTFHGALNLSAEERVPALVDLLTHLNGDRTQLSAVNELLHELGSRVQIRPTG